MVTEQNRRQGPVSHRDGAFLLSGRTAWLAFLHVSREYRRSGVAAALWFAGAEIAANAGATSIYVSATPSGSAIGFYTSRGCQLAETPHPALLAKEPEDIHLICPIA